MNALLSEKHICFGKIAVRFIVLILATVIFLGDGLCFLPKSDLNFAVSKSLYGENLAVLNSDFEESMKIAHEKLWRMSIDRRYKGAVISTVKEGVVHARMTKYINRKPIRINVIEVNPKVNPDVKISPVLAGETLANKSSVVKISQKNNAFAAINGSFFKPQTGVPLGVLMIDKKLLTGPLYDRVALGITNTGFKMDRLSLDAKILCEKSQIKVHNINQPRTISTDVIVYTEDWGAYSTKTPKYGVQVAIQDGKIISYSYNALKIPKNGYVISGPEKVICPILFNKKGFLKKNQKLALIVKTIPNWEDVNHIIGGGPFLIKDGKLFVDYIEEKFKPITGNNPRTAIGYTKNGQFIMITIDGREEQSVGVGLYDLAKIMLSLECDYAMNLDGGSSSIMQINGKIVNKPSIKGGIAVSNALVLSVNEIIAEK